MYKEEMVTISTFEYNELTNRRSSKAAAITMLDETTRIPLKQYRELLIDQAFRKNKAEALRSKAASTLIRANINKAQLIHNFVTK